MKFFGKIFLLLLLIIPLLTEAQIKGPRRMAGGFSTLGRHKHYKEVIFGIGAANFLGEVGGANQIGTHFWVKDLDFVATRPSAQLSYRLKFEEHWAVRGGFYYQRVTGSDKYTTEIYRHNRNLSFSTNLFEISGQVEYFYTKENPTKRYKIKGTKGYSNWNIQGYVFLGVGCLFFNPKAKYDGKWVALHPLGTEGQGLAGGPKSYSRFTVVIPYGLGFKQNIDKEWTAGIEFGLRKTYSDYIDDASNTYYNNASISQKRGATAAALADPKLQQMPSELDPYQNYEKRTLMGLSSANQTGSGQQRGDVKEKDSYLFVNITIGYKISSRHSRAFRRHRSHF